MPVAPRRLVTSSKRKARHCVVMSLASFVAPSQTHKDFSVFYFPLALANIKISCRPGDSRSNARTSRLLRIMLKVFVER